MGRRRHSLKADGTVIPTGSGTIGDLSDDATLQRAARGHDTLLLLLLNIHMAGMGINFVSQLRNHRLDNHLLLTPGAADCAGLARVWRAVGARESMCGWVSALMAHPGWAHYGINATLDSYALYASRWYLASRLTELGVSVLVLDVDAVLFVDVLALLRSRPLADYDVVMTDQGRGSGINCGFVYFNVHPSASQRPALPCITRQRSVARRGAPRHSACIGAAIWFSRVLWERFELFLGLAPAAIPLRRSGAANGEVLWEQDLWNDVLRSVEDDMLLHPWNWGKAAATPEAKAQWRKPPLSYERLRYDEKHIRGRKRVQIRSPFGEPSAYERAPPLLSEGRTFYLPLCAPRNLSVGGLPNRCLTAGRMLMSPPWLANLGTEPSLSWASTPTPQVAYVHPVSMWRCFGSGACYSKLNRVFWLRANGHWLERIDEPNVLPGRANVARGNLPSVVPGGVPASKRVGGVVLELSAATLARVRNFWELHRLLHNLVTIALLSGLTPRMPRVPCALFANWTNRLTPPQDSFVTERAAAPLRQYAWTNWKRLGIGIGDVLLLRGSTPDAPQCLLYPGGGHCPTDLVDHDFGGQGSGARGNTTGGGHVETLSLPVDALEAEADPNERMRIACRLAKKLVARQRRHATSSSSSNSHQTGAQRVVLEGIDPQSSFLLDRAPAWIGADELIRVLTEERRSGRERRRAFARNVSNECPGTLTWLKAHWECEFYFLQHPNVVQRSVDAINFSSRVALPSPPSQTQAPQWARRRLHQIDGLRTPSDSWQPITTMPSPANVSAARGGCAGRTTRVAAFLAGPVRSLLTPSVHRTIRSMYWNAFGGSRVVFARLYDVHLLDAPRMRRLQCVLGELSGGRGVWSAPRTSGKSFLSNTSSVSRCRFARGSQLAQFPYMAQSLERQLSTLRACYERMLVYESTVGERFDWILRTRTDTAFLLPATPPRCHAPLDSSTVLHARSFAKGGDVHHMFGDHAAVVPRQHARAFFVGLGERLAACVGSAGSMPSSHSEPESFIHHSLLALGAPSAAAVWIAPLVVSTDGRMAKWCGRYAKLGVPEVAALGATQAACAEAFLGSRWADVATIRGGHSAVELRHDTCGIATTASSSDRGASAPQGGSAIYARAAHRTAASKQPVSKATLASRGPALCSHQNGCCVRHPRSPGCV